MRKYWYVLDKFLLDSLQISYSRFDALSLSCDDDSACSRPALATTIPLVRDMPSLSPSPFLPSSYASMLCVRISALPSIGAEFILCQLGYGLIV